MELQNFLKTIGAFAFAIDVIMLTIVSGLATKNNQLYSTFITLAIAVLVGFITRLYSPTLLEFALQNLEYKDISRFIWYVGFILINYAAMYATAYIHRVQQKALSPVSKLIMFGFFLIICLNAMQYSEQLLIDKNLVLLVYQAGTSGVSILTAIFTAIYVTIAAIQLQKNRQGKKLWRL